jgi:hypothetical protein
VVEQIRLLGKALLGGIAQQKSDASAHQALQEDPSMSRDSKKSNLANDPWVHRGDRAGVTGRASWRSLSALLSGCWDKAARVLHTTGAGADGFWS